LAASVLRARAWTSAARAASRYAALHARDELKRYAGELRLSHGIDFSVRMGINSGAVVVGKIGDDHHGDDLADTTAT
jgi:class 3 adenylate cyclase